MQMMYFNNKRISNSLLDLLPYIKDRVLVYIGFLKDILKRRRKFGPF